MDSFNNAVLGVRRNEDIALDLLKFVAGTAGVGRPVAGGTTGYTYDGISDRIKTITDARGIVYLTNDYDANDRVTSSTDQFGHPSSTHYDAKGRVTSITDVLGNTTSSIYDARDEVIQTIYPVDPNYPAGSRRTMLTIPKQFVELTAAAYFFVPSITALRTVLT